MLTGMRFDMICHLGHKGIIDVCNDQTEQLRLSRHHGPRNVIDGVTHFLADFKYAPARLLSDFRAAGKRPGNGCIRNIGRFRDILDGYVFHHSISNFL